MGSEAFIATAAFDALNRPLAQTDPGGNVHAFGYDKGGMLKTVLLNGDVYVKDIHYDAKGQRQAIWYGNGAKARYGYDARTYRLRRLLTVRLGDNKTMQDLNYYYDPVGNITTIRDDAQQDVFFSNGFIAPGQSFAYDALYRLVTATGRELKAVAGGNADNWDDRAWKTDYKGNGNALQRYTQHYAYDAAGNMRQLRHVAGIGSYTRDYGINSQSNRMDSTAVDNDAPFAYSYDAAGNMVKMPHLSKMAWNATNGLGLVKRGSTTACYQYSGGQRMRKVVEKPSGIKEERAYLGGYEIYRKFAYGSLKTERHTVHVSDDTGRIAMLEMRNTDYDADGCEDVLTRYIYSNHLQSASLELDGDGEIISYEEYHPYGTTAYQAKNAAIAATAKRYRYTGKERDEESGLYYHGARYYVPWLCRWCAVDPLESKYAGMSPYNYSFNNPVVWNDLSGADPDDQKGNSFDSTGQNRKIDVSGPASHVMEDGSIVIDQTDESMKTVITKKGGITVTQDISTAAPISPPPPTAEQVLDDAYKGFIKKLQVDDFEGAVNVIKKAYSFSSIINSSLMSVLISQDPGVGENFVTRGPDGVGLAKFTEVSTGDLYNAASSKEKFTTLVISLAHEYIHGFQIAVKGMIGEGQMSDIREFLANQFSVFPNDSILQREGTISFNQKFPEGPDYNRLVWSSNAIGYYQRLPSEMQKRYIDDAEKLLDVGLKSWEAIKARIPDEKKDRFQKYYNVLINFKNKKQ